MFCKEQKIFKTISVAEALRSAHTMYVLFGFSDSNLILKDSCHFLQKCIMLGTGHIFLITFSSTA